MGEKNDTQKWPYQTELRRNFFKKKLPVRTNSHNYVHHKVILFQNSKPTSGLFIWIYHLFFNPKNFLIHKLYSNSIHHLHNCNDVSIR